VLQQNDNNPSVAVAQDLLNRDGALVDTDGQFGPGTARAVREFQANHGILPVTGVIDGVTWAQLRQLPEPSPDIPTRGVTFIAKAEVGSRAEYDTLCARPTWPQGESGITIGVGYDLGYEGKTFEADWGAILTPAQMTALRPWVGIQGAQAQAGKAALVAITIPWYAAWLVFIRQSLPSYIQQTRTAFPGSGGLPPLSFGMLVSLVYNRGTSMTDKPPGSGNRQEMRDIRDAIANGSFANVPNLFRAMERLWPNAAGLRLRRDQEADLFAEGLGQGNPGTPSA
jgi:peptidoglycan hydrolase-like protein with peptidoglycan-binding domain